MASYFSQPMSLIIWRASAGLIFRDLPVPGVRED
jgi:hypothetical protein